MEQKVAVFQNKGMSRDLSISKQNNEFAFENFNIRLTAKDGDTLFSVTSEKGNSKINIDEEYSYTATLNCYADGEWFLSDSYNKEINVIFTDITGATETTVIPSNTLSGNNFLTTGNKVSNIEVKIDGIAYDVNIVFHDNDDVEYTFDSIYHKELIIKGTLIGYSVLNNFLVLFTTENTDHIYRIKYHTLETPEWTGIELYNGNLNFSVEHPIETLSYYESEEVQKVYWVDGINQPRLINIMKGNYTDNEFDFVSSFDNSIKVNISKDYSSAGLFPSGTVQYFISYFRKFGQETNIVYSSDLLYSSFQNRGGSPEEVCTNSFRLELSNLDPSYNFVRVYCVVRTSYNTEVSAYIVGDYKIDDTVVVVDTGKEHSSIDPDIIKYSGGRIISADTLSQKDGTLFLGNLSLEEVESYSELEKIIHDTCFINSGEFEYGKSWESNVISFKNSKKLPIPEMTGFYPYKNQLNYSKSQISYFKGGEKYRFAIQFVNKYGSKTKAFWIGDKINTLYPITEGDAYYLSEVEFNMPEELKTYISDKYVEVILLMAETSSLTRSVLAQGVLNPTLFNLGLRSSGQLFSIPSWFMRPENSSLVSSHFSPLGATNTLQGEVQCNSYTLEDSPKPYYDSSYVPEEDSTKKIYRYRYVFAFHRSNLDGILGLAGFGVEIDYSKDGTDINRFYHNEQNGYWYLDSQIIYDIPFIFKLMQNVLSINGIPEEYIPSLQSVYDWIYSVNDDDIHFFSVDGDLNRSIPFEGEYTILPKEVLDDPNVHDITIIGTVDNKSQSFASENADKFFIDRNIFTFNTPDIEALSLYDEDTNIGFRIVGYSDITSNMTDYLININNPSSINNNILSIDFSKENISKNTDGLISYPLYMDSIDPDIDPDDSLTLYMIYPWHKNGSIIESKKSDRTLFSELKSKVLSNLRFSAYTYYYGYDKAVTPRTSLESLRVVTSTEKISYMLKAYNMQTVYNGNNDFAVINPKVFKIYTTGQTDLKNVNNITNVNISPLKRNNTDVESRDGVSIRYKSDKHAVISLGSFNVNDKTYYEVLPTDYGIDNYYGDSYLPWIKYPEEPVDTGNAKKLFNINNQLYVEACNAFYISVGGGASNMSCNIKIPYKEFMQEISFVSEDNRYLLIHNPEDTKYKYFVIDAYKALEEGNVFTTRKPFESPKFNVDYNTGGDTITVNLTNENEKLQSAKANGFEIKFIVEGEKDSQWYKLIETTEEITTGGYNFSLTEKSYPYRISLQFYKDASENGDFINSDTVTSITVNPGDSTSEVGSTTPIDPEEDIVTRMVNCDILPNDNLIVYNSVDNKYYKVESTSIEEVISNSGFGIYAKSLPEYSSYPHVLIGELFIDYSKIAPENDPRYGGISESAVNSNVFIPIGNGKADDSIIIGSDGDTYLQRWDCLKTYAFSEEDKNSVIDITSLMIESYTNIDGRYDNKRGLRNNLTVSPDDYNLINLVYSQEDNFITAAILDSKYNTSSYPYSITYTKTKQNLSDIDLWTNITLSSILDMDGDKGPVRAIRRFQNSLIAFQDKGIAEILYNTRTQLATQQGVPIEIANSGKVDGKRYITDKAGCLNKWSIVETSKGIYFIDNINSSISIFNGGIQSLSDAKGFKNWIGTNNYTDLWNPRDFNNFVAYWDRVNDDVYFLKKNTFDTHNTLCYNEQLQQFTSFYDYGDVPMIINVQDKFVAFKNSYLWKQGEGNYCKIFDEFQDFYVLYRVTPDPYGDKIFSTLEYRADMYDMNVPNQFIDNQGTLTNNTFDILKVWNEYQGNETQLNFGIKDKYPDNRRKFRIWRTDIPRDRKNSDNPFGLNRIRNPWIYLKLEKNMSKYNTDGESPDAHHNEKMEFNDLMVKYFE